MTGLKLVLCTSAAVLVTGFLVWNAEATPLTGAIDSPALGKYRSQVELASCMFGTTRCPVGTKWSCSHTKGASGERKFCHCRPC
jgi:hypothetical protein